MASTGGLHAAVPGQRPPERVSGEPPVRVDAAADPTLAALAACSYALEAAMFFREVTVHGTVSDPVPMHVLPFFAVACAALARGGKAKTA